MTLPPPSPTLAIVGAGPVGLALALQISRSLPGAAITVLDARAQDAPVAADPRTLALSLGSVQALERLQVWPAIAAQSAPIRTVHVSQQRPGLWGALAEASLLIRAEEERVPLLGAVSHYGALVAPLQAAWLEACAREPDRLASRFGTHVQAVKPLAGGVEIDAKVVDRFDLAVIAEGGLFNEQGRKAVARTYGQTAWVGQVTLEGGQRGIAYERFTPQGPAALLPLPDAADGSRRAALVWCVDRDDDPILALNDTQRLAVLNTVFAPGTGRISGMSPLKPYALGLNAEPSIVQGRTVRIGNAAQTLHPVAGQGLNLGLRDAHVLASCLAQHPSDIDRALRQLQRQRAPDRWSLMTATDLLARGFTWQWPGLDTVRALGLQALHRAAPLKSVLARHMMFGLR